MRTVKNKLQRHSNDDQGFSLVEMAIVLIIFGLFLSATLIPLSAQRDLSDYRTSRADLEQIKEALYGYALTNGKLPCPDTIGNDGVIDTCPSTSGSTGGDIPWATLGVPKTDPWNNPYHYRVSNTFTTNFSLSSAGNLDVKMSSSPANLVANNVPVVVYSSGKNGAIQPPPASNADEVENTTVGSKNDSTFVSHDITTDFDDIVIWIPPTILFNKMVSAGKLPQ